MPTTQDNDAPDNATLSATEREWLERQGRAARALEVRQRNSTAKRARLTLGAATATARRVPRYRGRI
jgi:hypothetical protein